MLYDSAVSPQALLIGILLKNEEKSGETCPHGVSAGMDGEMSVQSHSLPLLDGHGGFRQPNPSPIVRF